MQCKRPSNTPDPEDRELLKGKSPNYILGWNKVKYAGRVSTGKKQSPQRRVNEAEK
jgi:hypothetical protein